MLYPLPPINCHTTRHGISNINNMGFGSIVEKLGVATGGGN